MASGFLVPGSLKDLGNNAPSFASVPIIFVTNSAARRSNSYREISRVQSAHYVDIQTPAGFDGTQWTGYGPINITFVATIIDMTFGIENQLNQYRQLLSPRLSIAGLQAINGKVLLPPSKAIFWGGQGFPPVEVFVKNVSEQIIKIRNSGVGTDLNMARVGGSTLLEGYRSIPVEATMTVSLQVDTNSILFRGALLYQAASAINGALVQLKDSSVWSG